MTVDQQARKKLAESTRWLVGARITNYQFDDAVPKSKDPAIREISGHFLWPISCYLREHSLGGPAKLSPHQRDNTAPCMLILKSRLACPRPVPSRGMAALLTFAHLLAPGMARGTPSPPH